MLCALRTEAATRPLLALNPAFTARRENESISHFSKSLNIMKTRTMAYRTARMTGHLPQTRPRWRRLSVAVLRYVLKQQFEAARRVPSCNASGITRNMCTFPSAFPARYFRQKHLKRSRGYRAPGRQSCCPARGSWVCGAQRPRESVLILRVEQCTRSTRERVERCRRQHLKRSRGYRVQGT